MFYFALISVQNGDKWLWDDMKEIVFSQIIRYISCLCLNTGSINMVIKGRSKKYSIEEICREDY